MKELVLTKDAVRLLMESVADEIRIWESHNELISMHGIDEKVSYFLNKNEIKIGELKTLLNYLKSL
jgi:hypothetical protein